MEKHLGHIYQQSTKYSRESLGGKNLDWNNKLNHLLGIDGEQETIVYMASVGKKE